MKEEEDYERPKLEPKGNAYRLAEDWHTDCKGVFSQKVTVPKGFVTDGASIPRYLWWICGDPMAVPRIYAAIVHDWLYGGAGTVEYRTQDGELVRMDYTRQEADEIYRDYQIALGIRKFKAYTEYYALRACGWTHWKKDQ